MKAMHRGQGALWASAFVLAGLVVVQGSRLMGPGVAEGATVSSVGDLTVVTPRGSADEDTLMILDARSEQLLVYTVENRNRLELRQVARLGEMFAAARADAATRRR